MNLDQQRLGDYVLAEQLRQDKTGTVFRGFHATRKTEVAVKVLHERYGKDPAVLARFRRDAQTLARVEHPGLATVLDHGESAQGLFVVMESLVGESLADRLAREGRLSLADTQEIVGAVASALAAAHRVRVVHRDLKPDSIFLVRADAAGAGAKVKVLDLGLARILGDQGDASSKEVDQRADIHALGSVAYQMLSGHAPLAVSDLHEEGQGSREGQRPKPARLSAQGVTVPSAVEAAILKALERKKKRRFSSMAEFAQAFGVTLSPPAAPAPGATEPKVTARVPAPPPVPVAARVAPPPLPIATTVPVPVPVQARGPERLTTLAGLVAPLRELGRAAKAKAQAQGRRQIVAGVGGVALAVVAIVWIVVRSGGQTDPVAVEVKPPPGQPVDRTVGQPPARPAPPATAPSRVDEILALNQKAVSAYGQSDLKTARALLQEADKLAVANGYQDAMVRAQTQVRLGALWIGGEKNPRVGRRYLAKAVAINPAVKLPANMSTPQVRKALAGVRKKVAVKARVDTGRVQKRALHAKAARRHGRESKRAR